MDTEKPHIPNPEIEIENLNDELKNNAFIWHPDILERLRSVFCNKPVLVFDIDGVLRTEEAGIRDIAQLPINSQAVGILSELKALGYPIVFWTSGARQTSVNVLPEDLLQIPHLVIARENYRTQEVFDGHKFNWDDPKDRPYHDTKSRIVALGSAIDSADWLPGELRQSYKPTTGKHPELLFPNCAVIEDSNQYWRANGSLNYPHGPHYLIGEANSTKPKFIHYYVDTLKPGSDPAEGSFFNKGIMELIKQDIPIR